MRIVLLLLQSLGRFAGLSFLGCPAEKDARSTSQTRMKQIFYKMLDRTGPGRPVELVKVEVLRDLELLMTEHGETAELRHVPKQAQAFASSERLPCLPGILGTELLQLLWLKCLGGQEVQAVELLLESHRHFTRLLHILSW